MTVTSQTPPLLLYLALTKPRITVLCVLMTLGGLLISRAPLDLRSLSAVLIGTALSVSSANAINMYLERKSDAQMKRTRLRPLPMGLLPPKHALWFSVLIGLLSIPVLLLGTNFTTTLLSCAAIFLYGFVYTPLKKMTSHALEIGAIPGAIPPLLGWTAAENRVTGTGFFLFLILFFWQMPHFIAISDTYNRDYQAAGIQTVSDTYGEKRARTIAFIYSIILLTCSVIPIFYKDLSYFYGVLATLLGIYFISVTAKGLTEPSKKDWGRSVFIASIIYLPLITLVMVIDRIFFL